MNKLRIFAQSKTMGNMKKLLLAVFAIFVLAACDSNDDILNDGNGEYAPIDQKNLTYLKVYKGGGCVVGHEDDPDAYFLAPIIPEPVEKWPEWLKDTYYKDTNVGYGYILRAEIDGEVWYNINNLLSSNPVGFFASDPLYEYTMTESSYVEPMSKEKYNQLITSKR